MAILVTLWQLRKSASYSAFFAACLVVERNDFYLQELRCSNSRFVTPSYWRTDNWAPNSSRLPYPTPNQLCERQMLLTGVGVEKLFSRNCNNEICS